MTSKYLSLALFIIVLIGCQEQKSEKFHMPSESYEFVDTDVESVVKNQTVYVPIYSDIYQMSGQRRLALTATLSIRNTSLKADMYVSQVDYYDSQGRLVKEYLSKTILLKPLISVEFVVDYHEEAGGAGANFIVHWASQNKAKEPLIQAVMIGNTEGVSFLSEAVIIETIIRERVSE